MPKNKVWGRECPYPFTLGFNNNNIRSGRGKCATIFWEGETNRGRQSQIQHVLARHRLKYVLGLTISSNSQSFQAELARLQSLACTCNSPIENKFADFYTYLHVRQWSQSCVCFDIVREGLNLKPSPLYNMSTAYYFDINLTSPIFTKLFL